ncbi:hypothetical protein CAT67_11475 [Acinetobacter baumannii]|uniref:hypothetical protein n=1 Tax=Acinetobacter baumannii TaxID=470 RepID=UPI000A3820DB|nr:hypothetical protein [Acinetobacter baumannii]OTU00144.1 hypothetical protein CAT67_11475 [Acinetobacter baumannii]
MLKILAIAIVGSSAVYFAYNAWSKPEKKSKTSILISQAEQSIANANTNVKNADNYLRQIQEQHFEESKK